MFFVRNKKTKKYPLFQISKVNVIFQSGYMRRENKFYLRAVPPFTHLQTVLMDMD